MPDSRIPPIAYALLLIACLCIYGIILMPSTTFAGMDFQNLNYPRAIQAKAAFSQGHLPLWNWNEWGGAPLMAALQGSIFYPPMWAALALPLPWGLQLFVFAHLYIAALGACALALRILRLPLWAASLCGIIYSGNAFFPGRIEQLQIIAANTLLPWLLLAMWRTARGHNTVPALAILWALNLLAGHPQYAVLNVLGSAIFCAVSLTPSRLRNIRRTLRPLLTSSFALVLGTALAALQLFPSWELGQLSERIWPYPEPTQPELSWRLLPDLLVPRYYNILTGEPGRVFGFTELGLYSGLLALPLAVLALWRSTFWPTPAHSRQRRILIAAASLWLLAIIFALGSHAGLATLIYDYAPFFRQSRGAARSLNLAALMLALLASAGAFQLSRWIPRKIPRLTPRAAATTGWLLLALVLADLTFTHHPTLKSILVPSRPAPSPLPALKTAQAQAPASRIYRFMGTDSDLYLNNAPLAVRERQVRLQPNLLSPHFSLIDGYEEGLLPLRTHANLMRRYNRNLRTDSPDPALLAFLGSSIMLTEYPLPAAPAWAPISDPTPRPAIVPTVAGSQPLYQVWQSQYFVNTLALDASSLLPPGLLRTFFEHCASAFPLNTTHKSPPGTQPLSTPFSAITPRAFASAQQPYLGPAFTRNWNTMKLAPSTPTTQTVLLIPPYPGWKIAAEKSEDPTLKSLCSLFYMVESNFGTHGIEAVLIKFSPFSLRIGLFVSLISLCTLVTLSCRHRFHKRHPLGKGPSIESVTGKPQI